MSTLSGFVVGYVLGAKTGPQAFEKLGQAWSAITSSKEFHALVAAAFEEGQDLATRLQDVVDESGELRASLKTISESAEFQALVGGAMSLATSVLSQGRSMLGRGNGDGRAH